MRFFSYSACVFSGLALFSGLFTMNLSASAAEAPSKTVTDLKQAMGRNHFWMTMRTLPVDASSAQAGGTGGKQAQKCLLAYIEKARFRKKITLALILSAEKDQLLVQSGSAEWHLKPHQKGTLEFHAGHWIHHFNMRASKENEITTQVPEEEMRSLLNTFSRNMEGTLEYSSGKMVLLPLKNIAPEINDFKSCARYNHLADLGEPVQAPPPKGKTLKTPPPERPF